MAEHKEREHYIPLRCTDLIALLSREPGLEPGEQRRFQDFCRLLSALFHYEYHHNLNDLKESYAPFDPDADTVPLTDKVAGNRDSQLTNLLTNFQRILERANYIRLSQAQIEESMKQASDWGLSLSIDFSIFEHMEIYTRGDQIQERVTPRRFFGLLPGVEKNVEAYQRLIVLLRFKPSRKLPKNVDINSLYIKLFRDIPKADLEMLLPGTRVQMGWFDRGQIGLPILTGIGTVLYQVFSSVSKLVLFSIATLTDVFYFLAFVGGFVGYGVKSYFGYQTTKQRYQLTLTESLFFQNLGNNAGVLVHLVDEAEEQENREAILAYWFLWRQAGEEGLTCAELDDRVEQYLLERAKLHVDFEVEDAMSKLERLKLTQKGENGRYRAIPLDDALATLDERWDNFFQFHQPASAGGGSNILS